MARIPVYVLICADVENVEEELNRLLTPHDSNTKLLPYKQYLSANDLEFRMKYYRVAQNRPARVAELLTKKSGHDVFYDEEGFYEWSTANPDAKFDSWYTGSWFVWTEDRYWYV